ncbi:hypothetical protein CEE39_10160 [bacterium (candidate division B38) B3_B38]|nr:MAG: hypothetical protein CEE39_10160 [bacterium (candidate division B38) B3_B38]
MAKFTIGGKTYSVTADDIIKAMNDKEPEAIRNYYVEIANKRYPIKQVLYETLGLIKIAFTSMDAYRVLEKLGFEVKVER